MNEKTWIQASTGEAFDLLDPTPEMVHPLDIANGLSKICRYTGQSPFFYSVAQHSVHVWEYVVNELGIRSDHPLAQAALLHDASEAYCQDVSAPAKKVMRLLAEANGLSMNPYDALEASIHAVIRRRFKLPKEIWDDPIIKEADQRVYATERKYLFPNETKRPWTPDAAPIEWLRIRAWRDPVEGETGAAREKFLWAMQDAGLYAKPSPSALP